MRGFVPPENIRVLTGAHLAEPIRRATGLGNESILIETRARGTGPALAWAAWEIVRTDPDAVMISLHSDHVVAPTSRFREVLAAAAGIAAREDLLVTVAVPPDRPETAYGYISPGEALSAPKGHTAYRVAAFVEKPGHDDAARYVAGGYRWNSGIFVWRAAFFLAELRIHAPGIARALPLSSTATSPPSSIRPRPPAWTKRSWSAAGGSRPSMPPSIGTISAAGRRSPA